MEPSEKSTKVIYKVPKVHHIVEKKKTGEFYAAKIVRKAFIVNRIPFFQYAKQIN